MTLCRHANRKLKSLRETRHLTQGQLAYMVGVSQVAISYYENGINTMSVAIAIRIAKALNVKIEELL